MKNHPDIVFHLVTKNILDEGKEFTYVDCTIRNDLDTLYQTILEKTSCEQIPYISMCAGAQHLSLYHGGS